MATQNSRGKRISNIRVILFIGLAILIVTGGIIYFTKF